MAKSEQVVEAYRRNWDAEYFADIIAGTGFVISEPAEITLDGSKRKSLYGPQSPLYGTSYDDEQAFIERYRCECGEFKGRKFENEICPICGKPVVARDSDVNITGWIVLGKNSIINPYYYQLFTNVIGKNEFPDMINAKNKITKNGNKVRPTREDLDSEPLSPYSGRGIEYFYYHYDEILDYFNSVKKNKSERFEMLKKEKKNVFTSHIPIMSTLLRPQHSTTDSYYYNTVDKMINTIFSLSESLKNCADIEHDLLLQRIQEKVNDIWDQCFMLLNGKQGLIRGDILGGSLKYNSAN